MIPTMILVGLVIGLVPRQWEHALAVTVLIAVVVGVAWGLLVGALVGGALLALANIAVGALVGVGLQAAGQALFREPTR